MMALYIELTVDEQGATDVEFNAWRTEALKLNLDIFSMVLITRYDYSMSNLSK